MNVSINKAMPRVASAGHYCAGSEQDSDRTKNALLNTPDGHAMPLARAADTV